MKMKKQRKVVIALLLVLTLLVTGFTYAYWASGITVTDGTTQTPTIQIGTGKTVTSSVNVTGGTTNALNLVPVGREVSGESVSSITYNYAVKWENASNDNDATGATADLTVGAVLSGADASELGLFTVSITAPTANPYGMTYGDEITVTVVVEFTTEPADAAQYALIANKILTLTVTFAMGDVTPA
jgi:hypothetical protein